MFKECLMFRYRLFVLLAVAVSLVQPVVSWASLTGSAEKERRAADMTPDLGDEHTCTAVINGQKVILRDASDGPEFDENIDNTTFREIFFSGWRGECPSYIVLKHMTPELAESQRAAFCLSYDSETKQYLGFEPGERNA